DWTLPVTAREGDALVIEPTFGAASSVPATSNAASTETPVDGRPRRTAAFVVGGVGVAGLVVGGVFGALTFVEYGNRSSYGCTDPSPGAPGVCQPGGASAISTARTFSWVSNIGFAAGALGVGAGIVLLATAPSSPKSADRAELRLMPSAGPNGAGALVS